MVENVAGKTKASGVGVGSGEGKPTNDAKAKLPVPTGNFEENRKPVPIGVRVIEANTGSFFTTIEKIEKNYLVGFVDKRLGSDLLFL